MFKLILKHAITEFALTVMFDKLQENNFIFIPTFLKYTKYSKNV